MGARGCGKTVTPLAGVWIEIISKSIMMLVSIPSLPLRECGLKYKLFTKMWLTKVVTPLAGVWIEIAKRANQRLLSLESHSPCGSVD